MRASTSAAAARRAPVSVAPSRASAAAAAFRALSRSSIAVSILPASHRVGPFALTGLPLPHAVPNVWVRLEADGTVLAYTGDTGPSPLLAELGRSADLYIVEATDREGEAHRPTRTLLTAEEAGTWAARAGARRLLLTHFWPGRNRTASRAAARAVFDGEVLLADEDLVVRLGSA
jgi:ribonuclease BN (tRNA processing enzyme)